MARCSMWMMKRGPCRFPRRRLGAHRQFYHRSTYRLVRFGRLGPGRARGIFGTAVAVPDEFFSLARGDLLDRAAGDDRERLIRQNILVAPGTGFVVLAFDQQPILVSIFLAVAITPPHPHQVPAAMQLFAFEHEIEVALGIALVRIALR